MEVAGVHLGVIRPLVLLVEDGVLLPQTRLGVLLMRQVQDGAIRLLLKTQDGEVQRSNLTAGMCRSAALIEFVVHQPLFVFYEPSSIYCSLHTTDTTGDLHIATW